MSEQKTVSVFMRAFLALAILGLASGIAYYLIKNPAKTEKGEETVQQAVLVNVEPVEIGSYPITIDVMGQITPAREAALKARVEGEVIEIADEFVPGGFVEKDQVVMKIDPSDYELDVKVKEAAVQQAQAAFRLELGQQKIARKELEIIENSTGKKIKNKELALRKPQLEQARADLQAAKADLEIAQLNLERTEIKAPFNALIAERNSDLGNVVSMQDTLATLVSTNEFWIDAEIPVQNMRWLKLPKPMDLDGSKAVVKLDGGRGEHTGKLFKVTGSLNEQTRLAQILVSVSDPLVLNSSDRTRSPLVLGDFVRLHLIGKVLENAARLPSSYVRGNGQMWVARDGKLAIQKVTIAYQDRSYVYVVEGLNKGDRIITSNIATPVHGMDIQVQE